MSKEDDEDSSLDGIWETEGYDGPEWTDDDYPAWTDESSRVISGPLGNAHFPGTRHEVWQEAKQYVESKYRLLKFGTIHGRWFARISR